MSETDLKVFPGLGYYKLLKWDTQFFRYPIALLRLVYADEECLIKFLEQMRTRDVKLIYCIVEPDYFFGNTLLREKGVLLVDEKVTYAKEVSKEKDITICPEIISYSSAHVNDKLKSLVLQSGIYSRFNMDKKFNAGEFERLYLKWIENSVKRKIARDLLVYNVDGVEVGLVTLGIKNGRGDIGLLVVDGNYRGRAIGRKLAEAAIGKFIQWNITEAQVVTQKRNKIACEFYESIGFSIEKIENYYHIWL